jgi:hypothetical protein
VLPGWLFSDDGKVSFRFLGHCMVTYHNQARVNTPGLEPILILFETPNHGKIEITGPNLPSPYAKMVRDGQIQELNVWL